MSKVFITGGSGFFGKWLLKTGIKFLSQSSNIFVLCRNPDNFKNFSTGKEKIQKIKVIKGDVRSFDFPKEKFDFVIHCAMPSNYEDFKKEEILDIGINGTKRVLEFAKVCGAKRLLFVSSGVVYGSQPPYVDKISERDSGYVQLDSKSSKTYYAEAKRVGELLCFSAYDKGELDVVIARCFSFIGPYMKLDAHLAVGNFIRDALKGGPIIIKSDGTKINSYMYAEDLGIWLWTILLKGRSGEVYNVGSEKGISLKELAEKISEVSEKVLKLSKKPEVLILKKPDPKRIPERYVPSTKKARKELGLKEFTSLETAIERTLKFYQSFQGAFPDSQS